MKILVYEYLTGGGLLSQRLSRSLLMEGLLMLRALVQDLLAVPDVTLRLLLDKRIGNVGFPNDARIEAIRVASADEREAVWQQQLTRCDAVWVIAPETGGTLERLCRDAATTALLTCPMEAVALTADKEATARRLAANGIAIVPTNRASAIDRPLDFPIVVKPVDGAGGADCRILRRLADWEAWRRSVNPHHFVAQPLLTGAAMSLSALFNRGQARLLSCNRQHVREQDGCYVLEACSVHVCTKPRIRFEHLAERIAAAVPELWGYAGIDFIHQTHGDTVLEINPRLTTSYAGLRAALGINVAHWVIDLWRSGRLPDLVPAGSRTVRIDIGACDDH